MCVPEISKAVNLCMVSDSGLFIYAFYEGLCDVVSAGTIKGSLFECVIVFNYVFDIFFAL
jgi:hypothetical protein